MKTLKIVKGLIFIGIIISITATVLAVVWFGWKLAVVIFLALLGNNLERNNK